MPFVRPCPFPLGLSALRLLLLLLLLLGPPPCRPHEPSSLHPPLPGLPPTQEHCRWDERMALTLLFNATNGRLWRHPWNVRSDPCRDAWYGVTCAWDGHVVAIDLAGNHLVGRLPRQVFPRFRALQDLDLSFNHVTGFLPDSLAGLRDTLQVLSLAHNSLIGPVPAFLAGFPRLRVLDLEANAFDMPLPVALLTMSETRSDIHLYF